MGKILSKYRGYSSTELKNRASIPSAGNIIVNANDIDCSNISLNAVKNVLGAGTYSLYDLCRHANVNRWSEFSPIIHSINLGVFTNTLPTICRLGDFAGYNHNAVTPGWVPASKTSAEATRLFIPGNTVSLEAEITIGEINYPSPSVGVAMTVWNGATLSGYTIIPLSTLKDYVSFTIANGTAVTVGPLGGTTTFTVKFYIVNDLVNFTDDLLYVVCSIPNVTDINVTAKARISKSYALSYQHDPAGNDFAPSDLYVSTGDAGHVSWTDAYFPSDYSNGVTISVRICERNYETDTWTPVSGWTTVYTTPNYNAWFPIGYILSGEIWSGHTVGANDYLYDILVDANV